MTKHYTTLFLSLLPLLSFMACGGSETPAKLKIVNMLSPDRRAVHRDASADIKSSTAYSFATVDGIKVEITKLRGLDANSDNPLHEVTLSKEITLTGDPNQQVALNEDITWTPGSYRGIAVHFKNSWKVKAHCKTRRNTGGGFLVYTKADGIGTVPCTGDCDTLPSDYDYKTYSFLSTSSVYVESNDYNQDTHYAFTVAEGQTPIINALYDGSYNVACWDGSAWSSTDAIGAFRSPSSDSERQQFWPDGSAAFASFYLPFFGYLTTDANEAVPTARTYIGSLTQSDVDTSLSTFDFRDVEVMTGVYKSDGTMFTGSARNTQGSGSSSPLELNFDGYSANGSGWDFFASGWYWAGGSSTPEFIHNHKIVAFTPPTTVGTTFSTAFEPASGCGQSKIDSQGNNASRTCLTAGTFYWREMVR